MDKLQWSVFVPIFRNRFILRDLGLAAGIPFGVLIAAILIWSRGDIFGTDAKYALAMIAALFVLTVVLVFAVYGGQYAPSFVVDDTGITNTTQPRQRQRSRVLNGVLIALGAASRNPTAVGAGALAEARQRTHLKWAQIRAVQFYPNDCAIVVRGGFAGKMVVFCTPENYPAVERAIRKHAG